MSLGLCVTAVVVAATNLVAPEVAHFPGDLFETRGKERLQRRAMETWPGPAQMVGVWRAGELDEEGKIAVLLGLSASHDPILLPLYREAVVAESPRLRQAAAYGYRDLIADGLPNVSAGVDLEKGRLLADEVDAVAGTMRERPLVEFWLQALLMGEGKGMPGWRGVALRRPRKICLSGVEKTFSFDDFAFLAAAWRISDQQSTRFALVRLLEAVTLQSFLTLPSDGKTGWGMRDVNEGFEAADLFVATWLDIRCSTDPDLVLRTALGAMGVHNISPMAPESWDLWLTVLERGRPGWRVMAARRLYELGGRWTDLSVLTAEHSSNTRRFDELLRDYGLVSGRLVR